MTPRALITGITGQDGSYLAEHLLDRGYEVHGMVRRSSAERFDRVEHLRARMTLHQGDLLDERGLVDALRATEPDEIYNLAATPASWARPALVADINGTGVARMLEAVRETCPRARFFQASSWEIFGGAAGERCGEATPVRPQAAPGAAKAFGHFMTGAYRERHGLFACSGILFAHDSPRRGLDSATRRITWHAAAIKLGLRDDVEVGDLDAARDRGYAKDHVAAMWCALQQDEPGDYVVATGETRTLRECCEIAFGHVGLNWEQHVVAGDRTPEDEASPAGDATKAREQLGWEPKTSFEELIRLMVDADLKLLGG